MALKSTIFRESIHEILRPKWVYETSFPVTEEKILCEVLLIEINPSHFQCFTADNVQPSDVPICYLDFLEEFYILYTYSVDKRSSDAICKINRRTELS